MREFEVRSATAEAVPPILGLILELAEYEVLSHDADRLPPHTGTIEGRESLLRHPTITSPVCAEREY